MLLVVHKDVTELLELLMVDVYSYIRLCLHFLDVTDVNCPTQLMRLLRFILRPVPSFLYTRLFELSPHRLVVHLPHQRLTVIHNAQHGDPIRLTFDGSNLTWDSDLPRVKLCDTPSVDPT